MNPARNSPTAPATPLLAAVSIWLLASGVVSACGINWATPRSHFEGVSYQGYVFLVEELGEITLRSGTKLPIRALFRSESQRVSPYAGLGWEIPLLESNIVQVDERFFQLVEPSGWFRLFWRDEKDPGILHGQGNWKGTVRDSTISLVADCGSRLDFHNGRLVSMQVKDEKLDIERRPDGSAAIRQGGSTLISATPNTLTGNTDLAVDGKPLASLALTDRPLLQVAAGQPVVAGMGQSLGQVIPPDGPAHTMEYAVDARRNPTIKLDERLIAWDPASHRVVQDGDWTYDVKPGEGNFANAAIGRTNKQGQDEFWHDDPHKGHRIKKTIDGVTTVTTKFVTGKLAGKNRNLQQSKDGKVINEKSWIYNETGQLIHEVTKGKTTTFVYDENDRMTSSQDEAGNLLLSFAYDAKGRMVGKSDVSGKLVWERGYDSQDRIVRELTNGILYEHEFASDGKRRRYQKDPESGDILRRWSFNSDGNVVEFTTMRGEVFRIAYDAQGRKERMFRNQSLETLFIYEGANLARQVEFRPGGTHITNITEFETSRRAKTVSKVISGSEIATAELERIHSILSATNP